MYSPLLPQSTDSLPSSPPYRQHRTRRYCRIVPSLGRTGTIGLFIGIAALSGILFHILFFTTGVASRANEWRLKLPYASRPPPYVSPDTPLLTHESLPPPPSHGSPSNPFTAPTLQGNPELDQLSLEEIRDMVAGTKGFFSRDYSLGLGWNNVSLTTAATSPHDVILIRT